MVLARSRPVPIPQPCPTLLPGRPGAGVQSAVDSSDRPRDCQGASMLLTSLKGHFFLGFFFPLFALEWQWEVWHYVPRLEDPGRGQLWSPFREVSGSVVSFQLSGLLLGTAPLGLQFASNFNTIGLAISVQDPRSKPAPGTAALTCGQSSQRDLGRF